MPEFFRIEHHSQPPIQHNQIRLFPFVRSVSLRFPGRAGGFVWSKPTSLLVVYPDGGEQVLSIPDPTLRFILLMLLSVLSGWLVFRWLEHKILARRSN